MGKFLFLLIAGLLVFLISAGAQLGKGWSAAEQTRASADAIYRTAQARELEQRADDQEKLDELTRVDRAQAQALGLIGMAFGLALIALGGASAFNFYVFRRAKVKGLAPLVVRHGDVVTVYVHPRQLGVPAVTLCYNNALPLPIPTVVIDGQVASYPKLRPEVALALINGRTQVQITTAMADAWKGVQGSRERAEVLAQVLSLFTALGRSTNAVMAARQTIEGEGRTRSAQSVPAVER